MNRTTFTKALYYAVANIVTKKFGYDIKDENNDAFDQENVIVEEWDMGNGITILYKVMVRSMGYYNEAPAFSGFLYIDVRNEGVSIAFKDSTPKSYRDLSPYSGLVICKSKKVIEGEKDTPGDPEMDDDALGDFVYKADVLINYAARLNKPYVGGDHSSQEVHIETKAPSVKVDVSEEVKKISDRQAVFRAQDKLVQRVEANRVTETGIYIPEKEKAVVVTTNPVVNPIFQIHPTPPIDPVIHVHHTPPEVNVNVQPTPITVEAPKVVVDDNLGDTIQIDLQSARESFDKFKREVDLNNIEISQSEIMNYERFLVTYNTDTINSLKRGVTDFAFEIGDSGESPEQTLRSISTQLHPVLTVLTSMLDDVSDIKAHIKIYKERQVETALSRAKNDIVLQTTIKCEKLYEEILRFRGEVQVQLNEIDKFLKKLDDFSKSREYIVEHAEMLHTFYDGKTFAIGEFVQTKELIKLKNAYIRHYADIERKFVELNMTDYTKCKDDVDEIIDRLNALLIEREELIEKAEETEEEAEELSERYSVLKDTHKHLEEHFNVRNPTENEVAVMRGISAISDNIEKSFRESHVEGAKKQLHQLEAELRKMNKLIVQEDAIGNSDVSLVQDVGKFNLIDDNIKSYMVDDLDDTVALQSSEELVAKYVNDKIDLLRKIMGDHQSAAGVLTGNAAIRVMCTDIAFSLLRLVDVDEFKTRDFVSTEHPYRYAQIVISHGDAEEHMSTSNIVDIINTIFSTVDVKIRESVMDNTVELIEQFITRLVNSYEVKDDLKMFESAAENQATVLMLEDEDKPAANSLRNSYFQYYAGTVFMRQAMFLYNRCIQYEEYHKRMPNYNNVQYIARFDKSFLMAKGVMNTVLTTNDENLPAV